jgi:hypothetical protein
MINCWTAYMRANNRSTVNSEFIWCQRQRWGYVQNHRTNMRLRGICNCKLLKLDPSSCSCMGAPRRRPILFRHDVAPDLTHRPALQILFFFEKCTAVSLPHPKGGRRVYTCKLNYLSRQLAIFKSKHWLFHGLGTMTSAWPQYHIWKYLLSFKQWWRYFY